MNATAKELDIPILRSVNASAVILAQIAANIEKIAFPI